MTDEERRKIIEEEVFREEERKRLTKPTDRKSRILVFLNSGLGLWLLSSVALASISFAMTQIQADVKDRADTKARVEFLTLEGMLRISQWGQVLSNRQRQGDQLSSGEFQNLFDLLLRPPAESRRLGNNTFYSMSKEYDERSLLSILYELKSILRDDAKKKEIASDLGFLIEWNRRKNPRDSLREVLVELAKSPLQFNLSEWGGDSINDTPIPQGPAPTIEQSVRAAESLTRSASAAK